MAKEAKAKAAKASAANDDAKPNGDGKNGPKKAVDSRFASMHSDPRFKRFPKKAGKVEIDSRFSGMFTDEQFQVRAAVDKRGRKMKGTKSKEDMRRYYRLAAEEEEKELQGSAEAKKAPIQAAGKAGPKPSKEPRTKKPTNDDEDDDDDNDDDDDDDDDDDESDEEEEVKKTVKGAGKKKAGKANKAQEHGSDEEDDDDDEEEEEEGEEGSGDEGDRAQELYLRARGLAGPDSSDEDSSDDEDDSDADEDVELQDEAEKELEAMKREFGIGALAALDPDQQQVELVEDATKRIAIVDLDWGHVKAVDILAMLRSFCGSKGRVTRVTVYPSDYGLERMKQEAIAGPQIYQGSGAKGADEDDGDDEDDDEDEDDEEGEGGEVDKARLRYYERSRLRYYYAVAEFDTLQTSSRVYEACDGIEFEHSSCRLDLRFVPDEMDITQREVRDTAASVPADYESPVFQTTALMHSKVKLTWDADDSSRKKALQKVITEEEVKEDDIKAFLASDDSEEEEEDAEALRERYRSLLGLGGDSKAEAGGRGGGSGSGSKGWGKAAKADDSDEDEDDDEGAAKKAPNADGKFLTADKERDMEMEVTFNPSLEELGDRLKAKKEEAKNSAKDKTVWDEYLRKQKEKKSKKKAKRKGAESDDEGDEDAVDSDLDDGLYSRGGEGEADPFFQQDGADPFSDPFFQGAAAEDASPAAEKPKVNKGKKKGTKSTGGDEEAAETDNKAELEMLLMDDTALLAATRGVRPDKAPEQAEDAAAGKQRLSRKERIRRKKEAKLKARQYGSDDEDLGGSNAAGGFKADLQDPRFKALYADPRFALDPTEPQFQRGTGMTEMAKEVSKLRQTKAGQQGKGSKSQQGNAAAAKEAAKETSKDAGKGKESSDSVKAMVANLKRKAARDKTAEGNKKRHNK